MSSQLQKQFPVVMRYRKLGVVNLKGGRKRRYGFFDTKRCF